MDDKPDLSHLTPEERRIIEDVMNRQKQEEAKDAQLVGKSSTIRRQSMKEHVTTTRTAYTTNPSENPSNATIVNGEIVNKLSSTNNTNTSLPFGNAVVNMMTEAVHAVSGNSGSGITGVTGATTGHAANVCEACHKTKFADNSGNLCIYCKRRTCTRCGSHSEIKPNVIQWMCKDCLQSPNISERQQIQSGSNIPDHTNTTVNSITGRLGESIASFISKPKASDTKRHLPKLTLQIRI
ncbi:unnamed protein product [Heterobilharzia americana]|nr:unnamed protein product [Heterobilharzia americana]